MLLFGFSCITCFTFFSFFFPFSTLVSLMLVLFPVFVRLRVYFTLIVVVVNPQTSSSLTSEGPIVRTLWSPPRRVWATTSLLHRPVQRNVFFFFMSALRSRSWTLVSFRSSLAVNVCRAPLRVKHSQPRPPHPHIHRISSFIPFPLALVSTLHFCLIFPTVSYIFFPRFQSHRNTLRRWPLLSKPLRSLVFPLLPLGDGGPIVSLHVSHCPRFHLLFVAAVRPNAPPSSYFSSIPVSFSTFDRIGLSVSRPLASPW